MATKSTSKSKKGTTGKRYDEPVGVKGPVDELPPRQNQSQSREVVEEIVAAGGAYVELDPKGRQAGSVQSMISSAAKSLGHKISVTVRDGRVFAKLVTPKK